MTARRWAAVAAVGVAVVLLAGRGAASLYVDYRWYESLGAVSLWRMRTGTQLLIGALSTLAGGAFLFLNLWAVRRSVVSLVLPRRVANIEIGEEVPPRYLTVAAGVIAVALSAVLTIPNESWTTFALWRYGVEFGESDPFFATDLSYFVYWLPLETAVYIWAVIALILAAAVVIFLYALTPSLRWERGTLRASSYVRRHLTVLGVLLLMLLAWSYRLDAYATLGHGSGPEGILTAVDRNVVIPANLALAALTVGIGLVVLWSSWTGQMRIAFGGLTTVIVLSLGLRQALPVLVRRFGQTGDPSLREAAYVATSLSFTRRAYDTDRVRAPTAGVPTAGDATPTQLARDVSVWDPVVLSREIQRSHPGSVAEPALAWQASPDGRAIAAVVLRPPVAPQTGQPVAPWTVVRVFAAEADDRGAPVRLGAVAGPLDDATPLPPVYFADSIGGWVAVADSAGRFAAAPLDSWQSRLAHAWSLQDWRFLLGDIPQPAPRILLTRGVRERVHAIAPFFAQDRTVAPVLYADSLYWVLHLYAVSDAYPLSRRLRVADDEWSYFRHAAVAVVNAHTGRVQLVADSVLDPIGRTWRRAFPEGFVSWTALPPGFAALVPPALDGAYAQASALARCNGRPTCSDLTSPPSALHLAGPPGVDSSTTLAAEPLFVLPGEPRAPLAWSIPLADRGDRVRGLVVASGGEEHAVRWMPLDSTRAAPTWPSLVARLQIAADSGAADASAPGTLAKSGRVRSVPASGSALFALPRYATRADGGAALLRVAVAVGDSVAAGGPTLAAAMGQVGGSIPVPPGVTGPLVGPAFRARVAALYDAMQAALQRGDLAAFGRAYGELGALLGRGGAGRGRP
ncbi:MAG TPA: UPF0182 family protein [Gemmatimonadaceae bacterium]|nr:UPF0182 family protein [Gemmatimonadaceae bacterium]